MTIRALLLALPLLFLGWVSVLLSVAVLSDAAPALVVLFPSNAFLADLPANVAVLGSAPSTITLASETENFALSLYQSGARLVLPAGLPGCLPLPN
ncbi:hypothetical protein [Shimia abyssi]|uniref:Uncharacterized protein n=1 Tax=Shimia abyssi TaxID=1662395 RepID=A0A2P8FCB2_9RHOB|nr:hypothetical protein [Shimia abyssi]PSL19343.1 hypothetical protein CLV88_10655 [Shimia abyssi]